MAHSICTRAALGSMAQAHVQGSIIQLASTGRAAGRKAVAYVSSMRRWPDDPALGPNWLSGFGHAGRRTMDTVMRNQTWLKLKRCVGFTPEWGGLLRELIPGSQRQLAGLSG